MKIFRCLALAALVGGAVESAPAQDIKPFSIHVEDRVLEDLRARLERARLPHAIDGSGWEYGVDRGYFE